MEIIFYILFSLFSFVIFMYNIYLIINELEEEMSKNYFINYDNFKRKRKRNNRINEKV